jgi:phosphoribosylformylglycinamidine (FGAM) synthase-like enzyme
VPFAVIGRTTKEPMLVFTHGQRPVARLELTAVEAAWKRPLDLDQTLVQGGGR